MGPAAGKYATKSYSAGVQTDAAVGHFTASTHSNGQVRCRQQKQTPRCQHQCGNISADRSQALNCDDGATPAWSVKLDDADLMAGQNVASMTCSEATFGPTSKVVRGHGKERSLTTLILPT